MRLRPGCSAPRWCACRAPPGTTPGSRAGGTTTRAECRRRYGGSRGTTKAPGETASPSAGRSPRPRTRTRSRHAGRNSGRRAGTTSGGDRLASALGGLEQRLQLLEHPEQGVAGRAFRRGAVAPAAGLEQTVGSVSQLGGSLDVAAEEEDVTLGAQALIGERTLEARALRAAVARIAERPQ